MNKAKKVLLSITAIIVVIVCLVAILQWDNVKALYFIKTHTSEEIEEILDKNTETRKEAVSNLPVRELTKEEQEAIKSGTLGSDEAINNILNTGTNNEGSVDSETPKPLERDYDTELAELIGQIYILEATFSGAVDNLVSSAIAEYKALPPEQHTDTSKWNIGVKYLVLATSMEASSNQQMATILSQIENVLIESGGDLSLVEQIKSAYESEKVLKKDYYLSLYS